jgi:hypothetical protein
VPAAADRLTCPRVVLEDIDGTVGVLIAVTGRGVVVDVADAHGLGLACTG